LSREEQERVESINNSENLNDRISEGMRQLATEEARKGLYELAIATAAVNLEPTSEHSDCLKALAASIGIPFDGDALQQRIHYFRR
jgi:hypothetical protein